MANQMDAPLQSGFEQGFDATGSDMSGLAPRGQDNVGVALPGDPHAEQGWSFGADMSNLSPVDGIPETLSELGVEDGNESGLPGADDVAGSAGFHLVTSFSEMFGGAYSGTTPAPQGEQDIR